MKNKEQKPTTKKIQEKDELTLIRERQEQEMLLFNTEAFVKKPDIDQKIERFILERSLNVTVKDVKDLIDPTPNEYFPMFPNENPFFKLMFKLNGWKGDPNDFVKPPLCAVYIKRYIYARYKGDIMQYLRIKDNPLVAGSNYVRKYKLFQFLNKEGLEMLERFIKEANAIMETSKDWHDFELKYTAKYELYVQTKAELI